MIQEKRPAAMDKITDLQTLLSRRKRWRSAGKKVVFTNGCFDLLHRGHIHLFREAKALGSVLVVAVNDDESVRKIKGSTRPIFSLEERLEVLEALECIDALIPFSEPTPGKIIAALLPDVLVKGGDWTLDEVVGRTDVKREGGKTVLVRYLPGHSSSGIIDRIVRARRTQKGQKKARPSL